jgi:hypothetical protein
VLLAGMITLASWMGPPRDRHHATHGGDVGRQRVTILRSDKGSETNECGVWRKVGYFLPLEMPEPHNLWRAFGLVLEHSPEHLGLTPPWPMTGPPPWPA